MKQIVQAIINARNNTQVVKGMKTDLFESYSIHDAYSIQQEIIQNLGEEILGWKLGGTNKKTQEVFGVIEPYWGPVFKKDFVSSTDPIKHGSVMCGEIECAVKLAEIPKKSELDLTRLDDIIEEIGLSIELPWSTFESVAELGVNALVADLCATGKVVLGTTVPFSKFQEQMMDFSFLVNKEKVATGGMTNLVLGLEKTLKEFISLSSTEGFELKKGQWVFTGGLSSCQRFSKGDKISVQSIGLGEINLFIE